MKRIHTCVPKDIIYKGIVFKSCADAYTVSVLFDPHNSQNFMIDDGQPWFVIVYEVLGILLVIFPPYYGGLNVGLRKLNDFVIL